MCLERSDSNNAKAERNGTFPFTRLPVEIATEIIAVVISTDQKADLSSLGRVCKTIHHLVTPALYKCVFLSNKKTIARFAATMETAPRLCVLVENMWMLLVEEPYISSLDFEFDAGLAWEESASNSSGDDNSDDLDDSDLDLELEAEADPSDDWEYLNSETRITLPSASHVVQAYQFIGSAADPCATKPRMSLCSSELFLAVTDGSYTHVHGLAILNRLCTSLQRLYILSSNTFINCMVAIPFHILSEISLLTFPYDWPPVPGVKRLAILSTGSITLFDYGQLSGIFPNLTHLRIPLCNHEDALLSIASLKSLTHLWLIPNFTRNIYTLSLGAYLAGLPKFIVHVKLEIAITRPPPGFRDINWTLYPLVRLHIVGGSKEPYLQRYQSSTVSDMIGTFDL
ncbi:hypothetical protein K439DRAFT_281969 [Ramaria rubella]|nr:hypothetical protein K439DRAFT_281969 [Ramaria rubella]